MMAIFPRKYQRPRYSGMSGCPPLPPPALLPPALLLLQACCRGYAARAMLHMLQLLHWPHVLYILLDV